ncbi:MAG TPA: hypothetical protein VMZ29_03420 [Candidatus Bathyarchaeia archaeon]|nr:hypothetical protein [Candidatus Bathyarchaeia archaeon]
MVGFGLYRTPVQCNCSVGWIKENLEEVLEKPVTVKLEDSVLKGGAKSIFTVNY